MNQFDTKMTELADAIKAKNENAAAKLSIAGMIDAVNAIETGGGGTADIQFGYINTDGNFQEVDLTGDAPADTGTAIAIDAVTFNTGKEAPDYGENIDLSFITATAEDILAGKIGADTEGNPITGTLVESGKYYECASYTPDAEAYTRYSFTLSGAPNEDINGTYERTKWVESPEDTGDYVTTAEWKAANGYKIVEEYGYGEWSYSIKDSSGTTIYGIDMPLSERASDYSTIPWMDMDMYESVTLTFSTVQVEDFPATTLGWTGYEIVWTDATADLPARYIKSETLTEGLDVKGFTPEVGKVYSSDTTVMVAEYYEGDPLLIQFADIKTVVAKNRTAGLTYSSATTSTYDSFSFCDTLNIPPVVGKDGYIYFCSGGCNNATLHKMSPDDYTVTAAASAMQLATTSSNGAVPIPLPDGRLCILPTRSATASTIYYYNTATGELTSETKSFPGILAYQYDAQDRLWVAHNTSSGYHLSIVDVNTMQIAQTVVTTTNYNSANILLDKNGNIFWVRSYSDIRRVDSTTLEVTQVENLSGNVPYSTIADDGCFYGISGTTFGKFDPATLTETTSTISREAHTSNGWLFAPDGNFYGSYGERIYKVSPDGTVSTPGNLSGNRYQLRPIVHPNGSVHFIIALGNCRVLTPPEGLTNYSEDTLRGFFINQ